MKKDKILHMGDRGYVLIMVVFMMLVMAVMAFGMNRRAGMQAKMAANQTRSSQTHLGQIAALEEAAWDLEPLSCLANKQCRRGLRFQRHHLQPQSAGFLHGRF